MTCYRRRSTVTWRALSIKGIGNEDGVGIFDFSEDHGPTSETKFLTDFISSGGRLHSIFSPIGYQGRLTECKTYNTALSALPDGPLKRSFENLPLCVHVPILEELKKLSEKVHESANHFLDASTSVLPLLVHWTYKTSTKEEMKER